MYIQWVGDGEHEGKEKKNRNKYVTLFRGVRNGNMWSLAPYNYGSKTTISTRTRNYNFL